MKRLSIIIVAALLLLLSVCVLYQSRRPKGFDNPELADFYGRKVGVVYGTSHEKLAKESLGKSRIKVYDTQQVLFKALSEGTVEGALADESDRLAISARYPMAGFLPIGNGRQEIAFLFPKNVGSGKILSDFNAFLEEIRQEGLLSGLTNLWESGRGKLKYSHEAFHGANGRLKFGHVVAGTEEGEGRNSAMKMMDLELAALYCRRRGLALEVREVSFASLEEEISQGLVDLAGGHLAISPKRAAFGNFSTPYACDRSVLYYNRKGHGSPEGKKSLKDFEAARIGVHVGSCHEEIAKKRFPRATIEYLSDRSDLPVALASGKIDAYVLSKITGTPAKKTYSALTYVPNPLQIFEAGFIFAKTEKGAALRDEFDGFLKKFAKTPEFVRMTNAFLNFEEYEGPFAEVDKAGPRGTLHFATTLTAEPFAFAKDGRLTGLDLELARSFCRDKGYGLDISDGKFSSMLFAVSSGNCDFGGAGILKSEEREKSLNFSQTYFNCQAVLFYMGGEKPKESGEPWLDRTIRELKGSFERTFAREERYRLVLHGIGVTLLLALLAAIFGLIIGAFVCLAMMRGPSWLVSLTRLYIRILQGAPMVVTLMILYYVVFGSSGLPAFAVAVLAFALNFSAYVSEAMRSAIAAVDKGQREAALALGYGEKMAFWRFVLPQALLHFLPVFTGILVSMLKNTSIVGYVAVQDLTKMCDIIRSRTYEAFFPLIVVALIYFSVFLLLSFLLKKLEKAFSPCRGKRKIRGIRI